MSPNGFQSLLRAFRWLPMLPVLAAALVLDAPGSPPAEAGEPDVLAPDVLADVQARGYVRCGVHRSGVGLAEIRADGVWAGYFVEFCRVVALATVGDSNAIRVYEVDDLSAGLALADELVDVVLSTIRPLDAAADPGIAYLSPILEDEQLLVSFRAGITGVDDLPPTARICASGHPTVEANLRLALGEHGSPVEVRSYASIDGIFNAFFRYRCDALTHHHYAILAQSLLRSPQRSPIWRSEFALGDLAFAPSVRDDDPQWMALVDAAVRSALHDPGVDLHGIPPAVRDGFATRIQMISNSRSAIYDRTLGHMGGQGFYPAAPDPAANGS